MIKTATAKQAARLEVCADLADFADTNLSDAERAFTEAMKSARSFRDPDLTPAATERRRADIRNQAISAASEAFGEADKAHDLAKNALAAPIAWPVPDAAAVARREAAWRRYEMLLQTRTPARLIHEAPSHEALMALRENLPAWIEVHGQHLPEDLRDVDRLTGLIDRRFDETNDPGDDPEVVQLMTARVKHAETTAILGARLEGFKDLFWYESQGLQPANHISGGTSATSSAVLANRAAGLFTRYELEVDPKIASAAR